MVSTRTVCLTILSVLLVHYVSYAQKKETILINGNECVKNELIIKFKEAKFSQNKIKKEKEDVLKRHKGRIQKRWRIKAEHWKIEDENLEALLDSLNASSYVEYAEPNYIVRAYAIPNDPYFADQWGLHNTGQTGGTEDADIDAPEAWDITTGSPDILVGVIDSGIDYLHPDLAANIWTNPNEIPDNGIDDDGNGYIDDIHGWDFYNNDNDPMDDNGHGTHVAGIIGAVGGNGIGITGVAMQCKMMPLKFLDSDGTGPISAAISAVDYATLTSADLLNNSWGSTSSSQGLYDIINSAYGNDIVFVAAAGNDTSDNDLTHYFPASYNLPNIISVGSLDDNDQLSLFSNWGANSVDLGAPGSNIYSTLPGDNYGYLSGTSQAAPYVSGALVLAKAIYPELSALNLKEQVLSTVDPVFAIFGKTVSNGRLNAYKLCDGIFSVPINISTNFLDFRVVYVDSQSVCQKIYIKNISDEIVQIDSLTVSDGFLISKDSLYSQLINSFSISPYSIDSVYVVFKPVVTGLYNEFIAIHYSYLNYSQRNALVNISGRGVNFGTIIPGGMVTGVWSKITAPYYINGDIEVDSAMTLIIEPGVIVEFQGHYRFTVGNDAKLSATGTSLDSIYFTVSDKTEGWYGLRFLSSQDDDTLAYCYFAYSNKNDPVSTNYSDNCGGAIYIYHSDIFVNNCVFYHNKADRDGGGIYITAYCTPAIINSTFSNNYAGEGGGIGLHLYADGEFFNCLVANNEAYQGAGIVISHSNPELYNLTIVNNYSIDTGSAFDISGSSSCKCYNSIIWGNDDFYDPIFLSGSTIQFTNCCIEGEYEGINIIDDNPSFIRPTTGTGVSYNSMQADWGLDNNSSSINSGIIDTSNLFLPQTDLNGNQRIFGNVIDLGAYENQTSISQIATFPGNLRDFGSITLDDSLISDIFIYSGSVPLLIDSIEILQEAQSCFILSGEQSINTISENDYASFQVKFLPLQEGQFSASIIIYSNASNFPQKIITLTGKGVTGSIIPPGAVSGFWSVENSPFYIEGDVYVGNGNQLRMEPGIEVLFNGHNRFTVGENAQLIAVGTPADSIKFTATDTSIGWYGLRIINSGSDDSVRYCHISFSKKDGGTDADNYGGGIYITESNPIISNNKIINNKAFYGGGIYFDRGRITSNIIAENYADSQGGGIFYGNLSYDTSKTYITNNIIVNNQAYYTGGGISIYYTYNNFLINNTIANNSGSGISVTHGTAKIINSCIRGNNIYFDNNSSVEVNYSNIDGGFEGIGNIDFDPSFINPSEGVGLNYNGHQANWGLKDSSVCINSGINDTTSLIIPVFDIFGNPRILGSFIDIGAVENQAIVPQISTDPGNLVTFNPVLVGDSLVSNIRIFSGITSLTIDSLRIANNQSGPFKIIKLAEPINIAEDNSQIIQIQFKPLTDNMFQNQFLIYSNAYNYPLKVVKLLAHGIYGTTVPEGAVSGVWQKDNSPFNIVGDIFIENGDSLIIEAGVKVNFLAHQRFSVNENSTLIAVGVENDSIIFTAADTSIGWYGLRFNSSSGATKIRFCIFEYAKKAESQIREDKHGSAIYLHNTNAYISDSRFSKNFVKWGGAIHSWDYNSDTTFHPIIEKNKIIYNYGGNGASGIECQNSDPILKYNNISFNKGRGIYCNAYSKPQIIGNIISNNELAVGAGIICGERSEPLLINNIIVNNTATTYVGAIRVQTSSKITLVNNVICNNEGLAGREGMELLPGSELYMHNTILWGNGPQGSPQIIDWGADQILIEYSNIQNGITGTGNIFDEPDFVIPTTGIGKNFDGVSADWRLQSSSPCIDAGTPDTSALNIISIDLDGNERIWNGRIDMGPYEFGSGPSSGVNPEIHEIPKTFILSQNYPNPFNPVTSIRYGLPKPAHVEINVYNILGQKIATLVNGHKQSGYHLAEFDGADLASGLYFYHIKAGTFEKVKKMLLIR